MCLSAVMLLVGTTAWALDKVNGVYQIGSADDLKAFTEIVNGGDNDVNAVLTADIDYGITSTQIGVADTDAGAYTGCFDGQGHSITINMFATAAYQSLFKYIGHKGRVRNLVVKGSITTDFKFAAAIAGDCHGTIENCVVDITINSGISGDATHGALVARAMHGSAYYNCLAKVKLVSATSTNCGGIIGWMSGKMSIENCLNIDDFQLETLGSDGGNSATVGRNFNAKLGRAYNVFYLQATGDTDGGIQITEDDLKSGKVCYMLNHDQSDIQWTQNIGEDDYPVPFKTRKQVYCSAATKCDGTTDDANATYSNDASKSGVVTKHELHAGFCGVCEGMNKNVDGITTSNSSCVNSEYKGYWDPHFVERDDQGWYLVRTAEDMLWLAYTEPMFNELPCIKIMNDIDYSEHGFWFNASNWFAGVVDGQNHKITVNIVGEGNLTGLFPQLAGDVRNLWIDGEMSTSRTFGGSIFGETQDDATRGNGHATMNNILSTVTITNTMAGDGTTGGLGGRATKRCYMYNCIFAGKFIADQAHSNGGLVGWSSTATHMANCVQIGEYTCLESSCNTFSRNPGYLTIEGPIYYLNALGDTPADAIQLTDDEVKSGKLAFMLNSGQEGLMWTQQLGIDDFPFPFPTHGQVYAIPSEGFRCDGTPMGNTTYSNDGNAVNIPPHKFNKGFCDVCDVYDPDYLQPNGDGFYELATGRDVAWFAHKVVDGGNTRINGLLTADVD
ncbi:MAG: hypothetical protein K5945_09300, partial [Bacteroidaceae bacterium]|nr:hypothetical protein [Bacteroidaceae bacterium]